MALLIAIPIIIAAQLFVAWLIWLALGVVLPAFGIKALGYWVVFAGWFLLCAVGKAIKGNS